MMMASRSRALSRSFDACGNAPRRIESCLQALKVFGVKRSAMKDLPHFHRKRRTTRIAASRAARSEPYIRALTLWDEPLSLARADVPKFRYGVIGELGLIDLSGAIKGKQGIAHDVRQSIEIGVGKTSLALQGKQSRSLRSRSCQEWLLVWRNVRRGGFKTRFLPGSSSGVRTKFGPRRLYRSYNVAARPASNSNTSVVTSPTPKETVS
jgi:hypothetical protein